MNRVKGGCKTPSERPFSCRGWPLYNFLFLFICLSNLSHANKFRYSFIHSKHELLKEIRLHYSLMI